MFSHLGAAAALVIAVLTIAGTGANAASRTQPSLPDVLTKAIAHYATLASYADTGSVVIDTGTEVTEARFTTFFRRSTRDLMFDFRTLWRMTVSNKYKIDLSAYRTVVWMFKGEMQTYNYKLRTHDIINPDNGGQVRALQGTSYATSGASIMITSLLYSQARLPSAILQLEEAQLVGVEDVNGRRCHKVTGIAAAYYPSGQRTSIRPVTVWIDTETQLVRRVLEDTPKAIVSGGAVLRVTFDYQPQANPAIDDSKFQFSAPTP